VTLVSHIPSIPLPNQNLPIFKGRLSTQDNFTHLAFDLPALERSPTTAGENLLPKGTQNAKIGA
jgi:hypothetical protein